MISGWAEGFSGVLKALGLYSSSIYLLHTIFMGPVKIAINQIMRSAIAAKLILGKDNV